MNPQPSTLNQFALSSTVITAPPRIAVPVVVHKTNTREEPVSNSDVEIALGIILGVSLIGVLGLWRLSKMVSR